MRRVFKTLLRKVTLDFLFGEDGLEGEATLEFNSVVMRLFLAAAFSMFKGSVTL